MARGEREEEQPAGRVVGDDRRVLDVQQVQAVQSSRASEVADRSGPREQRVGCAPSGRSIVMQR